MTPHEYVTLEIARERERQIAQEGWTPEHDDGHVHGELAAAASCYAMYHTSVVEAVAKHIPIAWPISWGLAW